MSAYIGVRDCTARIDTLQRDTDQRPSPASMDRYTQDPSDKTKVAHVQWRCLPDTVDQRRIKDGR